MPTQRSQKILIYRLGSLGDTIMALPCFHKIREQYPEADITLLTNKPVASKAAPVEAVLGKEYFFNRVLVYPIGTRNPLVLLSLIGEIRSLKIDTVINLTASRSVAAVRRDNWFFRAAGVKHRIGFPTKSEDLFLVRDNTTGDYEWEAKRLARRVQRLGPIALQENQYWDLRLSETELTKARELLTVLPANAPIIAVSAGTKIQAKDWGNSNWLELTTNLKNVLPEWNLVLLGASDEADEAQQYAAVWGKNSLNLCGKASPRESAAVLQQCRLFIGHDSGPMHLAACVSVPCVAIFSARNLPRQWYPRGDFNQILYHRTDCAGCGLEVCIEQQRKCIRSITTEEVIHAVKQVVQRQQITANSL